MLDILRTACERFLSSSYAIEELQARILETERWLTNYEDKQLRKYLTAAEAELEIIRFTDSGQSAVVRASKVAGDILQRLQTDKPSPTG